MSVSLRKRKKADGTISLHLDIYHDGKRSYEFLSELKLSSKKKKIKAANCLLEK